tara:strand:+ start:978 stop:1250 length:273 start_codon:yes stop_codon:yes gene_type:complete
MNFLFAACPPVYTLPGTWTKCKTPLIQHLNLAPGPAFAVFLGLLAIALVCYGIYMSFGSGNEGLTDQIDEHAKLHEIGMAHGHSPKTKHD